MRGSRRRGAGTRGSDLPDRAAKVRKRVQLAENDLDLLAGPVNRSCEDGLVILRRELPGQAANVRQVRGARGQQVEDDREATAGAGDGGAGAGGVLREAKHGGAVVEERAEPKTFIKTRAILERGKVGDELDRSVALIAGKHDQPIEQILIRKRLSRSEHVRFHDLVYHGLFSRPAMPLAGRRNGERQQVRAAEMTSSGESLQRPVGDRGRRWRAAGLCKHLARVKTRVQNERRSRINTLQGHELADRELQVELLSRRVR